MFDGLYIASLSSLYLFIVDKVLMYCTSKQIDVFVMALWWLIKYEYNLPIHNLQYVDKGRLPKRRKYRKISGWEQVLKWVIKDLGKIPAWRRGKLLSVNRNTNWFKRILWEFQLSQNKTMRYRKRCSKIKR
jgi:hypothetical protein